MGPVFEWARQHTGERGSDNITIGGEPTEHRWRLLDQLAAQPNMRLVGVCSPCWIGRARDSECYTRGKIDDKDAVLIARLVAQLDCYRRARG